MIHALCRAIAAAAALAIGLGAAAQTPQQGDWGKSHDTDIRVLTWNVEDGVRTGADKRDANNQWAAIARVLAALEPDIIVLQEAGDNAGAGDSGGADSAAELQTVLRLLVEGGQDPFEGGTVGAYIQKYRPDLNYPYVYASTITDGFNRNVILSRFPFADLNNDLFGAINPNISLSGDLYAPGGTGGVRGFAFAEIDLPDSDYAGDLVVGFGHLKAGTGCDDVEDREQAARNIAYFIDHFFNGAGTGTVDPRNRIVNDRNSGDPSGPTVVLSPETPVIWAGDFNQTPLSSPCGTQQSPVQWMVNATTAQSDGTDRDGSPSTYDTAVQPLTGFSGTKGNAKLDYICWQDSIAAARRQWVFSTVGWPTGTPYPAPVDTFPGGAAWITNRASDHVPVLVDFMLPLRPPCTADFNGSGGQPDSADLIAFIAAFRNADPAADLNNSGGPDARDVLLFIRAFRAGC